MIVGFGRPTAGQVSVNFLPFNVVKLSPILPLNGSFSYQIMYALDFRILGDMGAANKQNLSLLSSLCLSSKEHFFLLVVSRLL